MSEYNSFFKPLTALKKTFFGKIDGRCVALLLSLMTISLLVISSTTSSFSLEEEGVLFFTPRVEKQLKFFAIGWGVFFCMSAIDYRKLYDWTWVFYLGTILLLTGLFFVPAIQNVHRWYKIGGFEFQPSEYAKIVVIMALSCFFKKKEGEKDSWKTALQALAILGVPFILILKEPDLGTSLVLFPIGVMLFYIGGIKKSVVHFLSCLMAIGLVIVSFFFLGIIDHEKMRPYAKNVLKEYQYERLNPHTYHQKAAQTAISLGGMTGSGWRKSTFTKGQWLPAAPTDSVFPAFAEEFGFLGVALLLSIFFGLIYLGFQVAVEARDLFGRLLAAGIATYLAMHIIVNVGMMSGFLPITGVPLILVSYGGSSVVTTMGALGILQSIYKRRLIFT